MTWPPFLVLLAALICSMNFSYALLSWSQLEP